MKKNVNFLKKQKIFKLALRKTDKKRKNPAQNELFHNNSIQKGAQLTNM